MILYQFDKCLLQMISCPVASVLYSKGRQQATAPESNRQEGFRARKKFKFPVDIHANFYTNDINGHDMI
ncbi:hypothetical protein [Okeania sp. SIO2B3]|uniref:hypothetical protein n=1 Tax=Okeania sp. SIO2B3 TaxID=2607784 RepID=UPI0025FFAFE7|nr:hypothetical protein [Okeania sp. SIO2B3]